MDLLFGRMVSRFEQLNPGDCHFVVSSTVGDFLVETRQVPRGFILQVFHRDGVDFVWGCRTALPDVTRSPRKARARHERLVRLLGDAIVVPKGTTGVRRRRWLIKTSNRIVFARSDLPAAQAVLWKLQYG